MLVAKFNCPACEAALKPSAPVPSGKKLKCPRCTRVIVVPAPEEEVEEVEEFDEVEEVEEEAPRKRPRAGREAIREGRPSRRPAAREEDEEEEDERPRKKRDEEGEEERPSRRRASREDDEEEDEDEERPRKKSKKSKKKAGGGGSGVKIAIFAGVGVLLLAMLGVGGYFLAGLFGNPRIRALEGATSTLATVKDEASAKAARPALVSYGQNLRELYEKDMAETKKAMANAKFDPEAFKRAVDEAMKNPEKAKAKAEEMEKKQLPLKTAMQNLIAEAKRVNGVPGGKELLSAFWDAWGEGAIGLKMAVGLSAMQDAFVPPQAGQPSNGPPKKGDFSTVRLGMTEQQVIDIMGKPFNIDTSRPGLRVLSYITGAVDIKDGKVVKKFP